MNLLVRIFRFMVSEQVLALYSTLLSRLECLEVCATTLDVANPQVDLFMNIALPPFIEIISSAPLSTLNGFMRILLERHNIVWLAKNRVGLAILTGILSRAEIVKTVADDASEKEIALWFDLSNPGVKFTILYLFRYKTNSHHYSLQTFAL